MKQIDLKDYVLSGEGANGKSYDSLTEPEMMVKLYKKEYDTDAIFQEYELARKVYDLGVPSPEPGELVTDGERIGIRFRRIVGKRSFARAFSQEPERVEELSREFAAYCKRLHSMTCPPGYFPDARESFQKLLDADKVLSPAEKQRVHDFIWHRMPLCDTLLHGDMHFGNALTTLPKGEPLSAKHDVYFIDLGYFAYGCPLIDLGMTYMIGKFSDEEFLMHDMHFGNEIAGRAWEAFRQEYFFGPDCLAEKWFGPGADAQRVDEGLKPYVLLKLLLVEYNCGFMPPLYIDFCHSVFGD